MKFSEQWLRQWVDPAISTEELLAQLTMAGLEVESVEPVAADFSGVIVGEIVSVAPHSDASKLQVCQVANGKELQQVVCGAPNARPGLKAPFATLGALLPGDLIIKKAKLRGIESFGMLCGADELGIHDSKGSEDSGLLELPAEAPVGQDLREYLELNDSIIELSLTPNRGDCLSIAGLAREVGVLNKMTVTSPHVPGIIPSHSESFSVSLEAGRDCSRYVGRIIRSINPDAKTPIWMQERLRRSGIRNISPVVDVTNYVLLEYGQPMHAFDLDRLSGGIVVRHAEEGERLALLDGQTVELKAGTLVIADQQKPVAMAGIMGGAETAVDDQTKNLFLESAFFAPVAMAGRARSYGLHTDSSYRFERGVDYGLQERAIERATQLLVDIVGGEVGPVIAVELRNELPAVRKIQLRRARIKKLLGLEIVDAEVAEILQYLGLDIQATDDGWEATIPSYRFDLTIEADLLEELARIHGYNRLPVQVQSGALEMPAKKETVLSLGTLRTPLIERGYQEAITYSFIEPDLQKLFSPEQPPVKVANPISQDMAVMRTSLWPGLVRTLMYNQNRQRSRVRLFESGLIFIQETNGLRQDTVLAGLLWGNDMPENWAIPPRKVDFYDLKGHVEALLALSSNEPDEYTFKPIGVPALHPGQAAVVLRCGQQVGQLGALHPAIQQQLGITGSVYLFELDTQKIQTKKLPKFNELSKFPEVRRDLAIVVDEQVQTGDVLASVREVAGDYLWDLKLFDVYRGKGIDSSRKSLAFGLTLRDSSRTLKDEEVSDITTKVIATLKQRYNATLRD